MSRAGYLIMPQLPGSYSSSTPAYPSFPVSVPGRAAAASPAISTSARTPGTGTTFRAPAHKHAHHLHSIPPREKSTRTLIVDHLASVHARARFAQARAELGLVARYDPDRLEQGDADEDDPEASGINSDGEDADVLCEHGAQDERRWAVRQDTALARVLKARAEGLERVVTSMLDQPPELRPTHPNEADFITPPPSPKHRRNPMHAHPHTLPDGVRLRLTLATLINDLFARGSMAVIPPQPQLQHQGSGSDSSESLAALANISNCSAPTGGFRPEPTPLMVPPPPTPLDAHSHALYANLQLQHHPQQPPSSISAHAHLRSRCVRHLLSGCSICLDPPQHRTGVPLRLRAGIGSGLSRPGAAGTLLRRRDSPGLSPGSSTRIADMLPRFLRLSALVASELARESSGEGGSRSGTTTPSGASDAGDLPDTQLFPSTSSTVRAGERSPRPTPCRPTRQWYMLLAGLITRAALEGYASHAWRGPKAAQILFGIGLPGATGFGPVSGRVGRPQDPPDEFAWFDPDEMPSLQEADMVLFGDFALDGVGMMSAASAEDASAEFRREMRDRLHKFLTIPTSTSDLLTHLYHLSALYPAEPVERAALRFCEAVARWRGKPELQPKSTAHAKRQTPSDQILPLDALVRSNPGSPTVPFYHPRQQPPMTYTDPTPSMFPSMSQAPPIQAYFELPVGVWLGKRKRTPSPYVGLEKRPRPGA